MSWSTDNRSWSEECGIDDDFTINRGNKLKDYSGELCLTISVKKVGNTKTLRLNVLGVEYVSNVNLDGSVRYGSDIDRKFLQPLQAPFLKLKPEIMQMYFRDNIAACEAIKTFYQKQDSLLHDYRSRYANMFVLSAFLSKCVIDHFSHHGFYMNIPLFAMYTYSGSILFPLLLEETTIGELESSYNRKTRGIRESLDKALGETISSYVPHLDTFARLGGAYIASSLICDEPLVKGAIAIACALQPAVSKYVHERPYMDEHGVYNNF